MIYRSPEDDDDINKIDEDINKIDDEIKKIDTQIKTNERLAIGFSSLACIGGIVAMGLLMVYLIKDSFPHSVPCKYEIVSEGTTYWSDDVVFNSDGSIWFKPIDSDEHVYINGVYKVTIYDVDDEED